MPTTPGCQPSPQRTIAAPGSRSASSSARRRFASAKTSRSVSRRSWFARSSSTAISPARSGIVAQEKLHRGVGAVEATGGVDPRRKPEADVRLVNALGRDLRDLHERAQADPGRAAHLIEPAAHERAVLAEERDHVCDGGQRDQVEIALGALDAQERAGDLVSDARGAEVGARVSRDDGMDDRAIGELRARLVVVGDDDVDAERPCVCDLVDRRDPAVGGDQEASAALGQPVDRLAAEAVAVLDAPGDKPVALGASVAQGADEDRGGGGAVDVVVAVDRDRLLRGDRTPDRRNRGVHSRELGRIVALVGGQELASVLDRAVTRGAPKRPRRSRAPQARGRSRPPRRTSTEQVESSFGPGPSRKGSPTQARRGRGRNRPRAWS